MGQVSVILRDEVPGLGHAGDVVDVKPGYARNFLLPKGLAALATAGRVKELEHHKRVIEEKMARALKDLEALKRKIETTSLEVTAQAGEGGKLFGSVTSAQICDLLAERGIEIDRRKILLPEPVKQVGEHVVPVRLHRDLTAEIKLRVEAVGGGPAAPVAEEEEESAGEETTTESE